VEAGDIIAIYAALVATLALGSNIYAAWSARRRRVKAVVALGFVPDPLGRATARQVIGVTAINRGHVPVSIEGVGLDAQDGSGGTFVPLSIPFGANLPGIVPPNESRWSYLERDEVEANGWNLHQPIRGWVRLATGEIVKAKPVRLLAPE
jgi:hypothetical protein